MGLQEVAVRYTVTACLTFISVSVQRDRERLNSNALRPSNLALEEHLGCAVHIRSACEIPVESAGSHLHALVCFQEGEVLD